MNEFIFRGVKILSFIIRAIYILRWIDSCYFLATGQFQNVYKVLASASLYQLLENWDLCQ